MSQSAPPPSTSDGASTGLLLALVLAIFVAPVGLFLGVRRLVSARRAHIVAPELAVAAVVVGAVGTVALIGGGFGVVALKNMYDDGQRADAFCRRAAADPTAAGDAAALVPQIEAALATDPATVDGAATRAAVKKQIYDALGRVNTITGNVGHGYIDPFMKGSYLWNALSSYWDILDAGTGPMPGNFHEPPPGGPGAISGLADRFEIAIKTQCG